MGTSADTMSEADSNEFDGLLMNIAERRRGIDPMLDSVFGFLRRRTDFFKGVETKGRAEEAVMNAFRKHQELAEREEAKKKKEQKKKEKEKKKAPKMEELWPNKVIADPNKDGMIIEEVDED